MNITTFQKSLGAGPAKAGKTDGNSPQEPPKEYQIKEDQYDRADRYEESREFGNAVAGGVYGAVAETVGATVGLQSFRVGWNVVENAMQAETIGPNLKALSIIGGALAVPETIIAAPFAGAIRGVMQANEAGDDQTGKLTADTSAAFIDNRMSEDKKFQSTTSKVIESLEELGDKKLAEGEKPYDVPIVRPITTLVGAAGSAVVNVVGNLVGGLVAGALTTVKEAGGAIFGEKKGIGRLVSSPLYLVAIPYGLVKEGLKESVPRSFSDGWNESPVKAFTDTVKITAGTAGGAIKEAWNR